MHKVLEVKVLKVQKDLLRQVHKVIQAHKVLKTTLQVHKVVKELQEQEDHKVLRELLVILVQQVHKVHKVLHQIED